MFLCILLTSAFLCFLLIGTIGFDKIWKTSSDVCRKNPSVFPFFSSMLSPLASYLCFSMNSKLVNVPKSFAVIFNSTLQGRWPSLVINCQLNTNCNVSVHEKILQSWNNCRKMVCRWFSAILVCFYCRTISWIITLNKALKYLALLGIEISIYCCWEFEHFVVRHFVNFLFR